MNMFKIIAAAVVGNALEVYDMVVYGFLATTIGTTFFPREDKLIGIISTFAVFFIGYLTRPLGALIFGIMGDKVGRKPALRISILLMAFSTFSLGPPTNLYYYWSMGANFISHSKVVTRILCGWRTNRLNHFCCRTCS